MEENEHTSAGARGESGSRFADEEKLAVRLLNMSGNEKIKLALTGDAEARRLLLRDSNRMVQMSVMQNPRLTESEIITIANSRQTSDEILRCIINNRDWYKLYAVRLALVKNPKTPFTLAFRIISSLASHDLKLLAKSKSISPAVAQAARRITTKNK
jgi:hypothetical protein